MTTLNYSPRGFLSPATGFHYWQAGAIVEGRLLLGWRIEGHDDLFPEYELASGYRSYHLKDLTLGIEPVWMAHLPAEDSK